MVEEIKRLQRELNAAQEKYRKSLELKIPDLVADLTEYFKKIHLVILLLKILMLV